MPSRDGATKQISSRPAVRRKVRYAVVGRDPEPSGREGLADVRIIRALYRSAETGAAVTLDEFQRSTRPTIEQEIQQPAGKKPQLVRAASPTRE